MPGVSLDPVPGDAVRTGEPVELAPQVHVLDRLLVGGAPAAPLPVADPFADALLHVLRVGVDLDRAGAAQRLERADHCGQLHAVVGGLRLAAEQLTFAFAYFQQRAPSPRTGIALAGAVGVDAHDFSAVRACGQARFPFASR